MPVSFPTSPLRLIRWAAWGLVALLLAGSAYVLLTPDERKGISVGGPFSMMSTTGQVIDIATAENGKPYAVFFGFTNCPDICPTSMFEMSQALKQLGDSARNFHVYFVSVDPERDTVDQLKLYLSAFDPRIIGMVGTPEEVQRVAKQYRAFYRKVPTPSGYTMDHTATIYLFDRTGNFYGTVSTNDTEDARLAKLKRLMTK